MEVNGEILIRTIAGNKDSNPTVAKAAFTQYCSYYEERLMKIAVVLCKNFKSPEAVAYNIVQCAFEKVWKYPTFTMDEKNFKSIDRAMLSWLFTILLHEKLLYTNNGFCSHPDEEDLAIITSSSDFIKEKFKDEYIAPHDFELMKKCLDKILCGLNEKEITIYLTYKLYKRIHKNVPGSVLKKLRTRYNLSQDALRQCRYRIIQQIED
jgi:flavorubredoxin